jgi:hypothetical protein
MTTTPTPTRVDVNSFTYKAIRQACDTKEREQIVTQYPRVLEILTYIKQVILETDQPFIIVQWHVQENLPYSVATLQEILPAFGWTFSYNETDGGFIITPKR